MKIHQCTRNATWDLRNIWFRYPFPFNWEQLLPIHLTDGVLISKKYCFFRFFLVILNNLWNVNSSEDPDDKLLGETEKKIHWKLVFYNTE